MFLGSGSLERVQDGILIKAIGGLRLSMVQDVSPQNEAGTKNAEFRIQVINNVPLGKDEKVYISREITFDVLDPTDPNFTRVRDSAMIDIVIDVIPENLRRRNHSGDPQGSTAEHSPKHIIGESSADDKLGAVDPSASSVKSALSSFVNHVSWLLWDESQPQSAWPAAEKKPFLRLTLPAAMASGLGSAPMPDVEDSSTFSVTGDVPKSRLPWSTIYFADELCDHRILRDIAQTHQVLVIKRGGCSFSQKLRSIAAYPPSRHALRLVIVVSYEEEPIDENLEPQVNPFSSLAAVRAEPYLVRPYLDETQMTAGGVPRRHLISLVMVGGGAETYELLRQATGVGIKRRYTVRDRKSVV